MFQLIKIKQKYNYIFEFLILICMSFISTYFAFSGHFFNISHDGVYHLGRFLNVADSFRNLNFPEVVNLTHVSINSYPGVATNSFYPWLTGIIFIIPNLLFSNPMWALFFSFFILNIFTIISINSLLSYLTSNRLAVFTGIVIYQFNNYHFIDLYSRVAIGESIAYAFFPIVLLGIIKINHSDKFGFLLLGLSMGLLVNTHILTFLYAVFIVILFIIYLFLFDRKHLLDKLIQIIKSSIVAIFLGMYTIYNLVHMITNNHIEEPFKSIIALSPSGVFMSTINNEIGEHGAQNWSMGLPVTLLVILLGTYCLVTKSNYWKMYGSFSILFYFSLFTWIPYDLIKDSLLANVQFLGRLLIFVLISLSIGVSYLITFRKKNIKVSLIFGLNVVIIIFSLSALYNYHYNYFGPGTTHSKINSENYYGMINNTGTFADYLPKNIKKNNSNTKQNDNKKILKIVNSSPKEITYSAYSAKNVDYQIPFITYRGLNYVISSNGQKVYMSGNAKFIKVRLHRDKIK
ncbi:hypothetical protein [Lactiplantibacillus plantarum]|uniref:hypothetical protein n=1 Tax=Lactiplantibacillus plantarum TaxID=1590 RepID=UPI0008FB31B7|nr:hypothetical protein [Lactiplantibacillus plantarum]APB87245.1 hypothetical protein BL295_15825 [Lactiplantibacillus plantarum]